MWIDLKLLYFGVKSSYESQKGHMVAFSYDALDFGS